jgi:hypothetical protein
MKTCLRCGVNTKNYPKPGNDKTCGVCLHELHDNFKHSEDAKTVRGE